MAQVEDSNKSFITMLFRMTKRLALLLCKEINYFAGKLMVLGKNVILFTTHFPVRLFLLSDCFLDLNVYSICIAMSCAELGRQRSNEQCMDRGHISSRCECQSKK